MEDKKPPILPRKMRMRLIIAIPAIVVLFTLSSAILTFSLIRKISPIPPGEILFFILSLVAMIGLALLSSSLLAYGITNPLKKLAQRGFEILSSTSPEGFQRSGNELHDLDNVFKKISFSLNQFIQDHQILENLREGLILIDSSGTILSQNDRAEKFFGPSLTGQPYWKILPADPENRSLLGRIGGALGGKELLFPHEERIKNHNNQLFDLWLSISATQEPKGIMISIKDLEEIRFIREQIRRAEALAELGAFSSTLSHEIRNPLGAIHGLLELLQKDLPPEDRRRAFAERALKEVERLTNLTENFLNSLRVERLPLKAGVDLSEVLRQSLSLVRHELLTKGLIIEERYEEYLPPVEADPESLTQAFLNILLNAHRATPEGGVLSISSELLPSAISIGFRNSGSYIPPEERDRLFTPFLTTKPKGTGLGLFLTQRIVAAHHGTIGVESDPEQGTTFRVTLPLSKGGDFER